jgi:hypothetical protein
MNDTIKMCLKQYDKLHGKHKRTRTLCIKIELRVLSLWRLRLSLPFVQNAFVCSVRCVLLLVSSATVLQPMHVRGHARQQLHIDTVARVGQLYKVTKTIGPSRHCLPHQVSI